MASKEEALIGRVIAGKFAIEAHIGSGAMGQVFRARHLALEKTIAVKVLHSEIAHDETFTARFHREARAASRLDHPNSMRVLDFGAEPDGMLYIAMEYLDGRDLLRVISEDGLLPDGRIVAILTQVLAALVVAHDMGVVHRDLKPENIMILDGVDDEGRRADVVKVCDFGIAKINAHNLGGDGPTSTRKPITTAGLVVGTPEYMSPEQGRGDPLDARSDLYSVGVMLFQLLTGRLPFTAESALGLVFKQVNEPTPPPSSIRPGVSAPLERVCLKAMSKKPDDRYQTAREMRTAIRNAYLSEGGVLGSFPPGVPSSGDVRMEQAETIGVPVSFPRASQPSDHPSRELAAVGSPTGTTELPTVPVHSSGGWIIGAVAAAALVAGAVFGFVRWEGTEASGGPAAADSVVSNAPRAAPSAASSTAVDESTADHEVKSPLPAASATALIGPSVSAVAAHPTPAIAPPSPGKPATLPPQPASAGGDHAVGTVNLATAVASPSVTKATGVSAHDVRAAVPSWKLTQCYRTALAKTNKPDAGHLFFTLTIDGSGNVSRVGARGAGSLLSGAGDCIVDAFGHMTVANAPAGGASAEVDVEFSPH
jgi:eukaryotic-like serine/threonine-protein kinase